MPSHFRLVSTRAPHPGMIRVLHFPNPLGLSLLAGIVPLLIRRLMKLRSCNMMVCFFCMPNALAPQASDRFPLRPILREGGQSGFFLFRSGAKMSYRILSLVAFSIVVGGCASRNDQGVVPAAEMVEVRFYGKRVESVGLIEPSSCTLRKSFDADTNRPLRLVAGQPVALRITYGVGIWTRFGISQVQCAYAFRFTPQAGQKYEVWTRPPTQVRWNYTSDELDAKLPVDRPPDSMNCYTDVLEGERETQYSIWKQASRERICF